MQRLPLYLKGRSQGAVSSTAPMPRNPRCTRCKRTAPAQGAVCLMPDVTGPAGCVLVLADIATPRELETGRLWDAGEVRRERVKALVRATAPDAHVVYDVTLRCGDLPPRAEHADTCRPYLAQVLEVLHPARIVALGPLAMHALMSSWPADAYSARGGYAFLARGVPVFFVPEPEDLNPYALADFRITLRRALTWNPVPPPWEGSAFLVRTEEDAQHAARALSAAPWFAWDAETAGRPYDLGFRVLQVACAPAAHDAAYVWDAQALKDPAVRAPLFALLGDPDVEKVAQNASFDIGVMQAAYGLRVQCSGRCTMLRRGLLDVEARKGLEEQQALVGMYGGKEEMAGALIDARARVLAAVARAEGKAPLMLWPDELPSGTNLRHAREEPDAYAYAYVDPALLARYGALDAISTARLEMLHAPAVARASDLAWVWRRIVYPASAAVAQVTTWGVRVNGEGLDALEAFLRVQLGQVTRRLTTQGLLEPGSPDKVGAYLYGTLKLPVKARTKTGAPSTADDVLGALKPLHPSVADVQEWRRLDKLRGTYCEGLRGLVTADERIHVRYRIGGARSGRMSAEGGLHGLPRPETLEAKMVRDLFVPSPGWTFVELDLSQAELRVLAGLSGDPVMGVIFRSGLDLHQRTAELNARTIWGIAPEEVHARHRSEAKIINLAMVYGRGAAALAEEITLKSGVLCTKARAEEIRDAIMGGFSVAVAWMQAQARYCTAHGHTRTFLDGQPARRRVLWDIATPGDGEKARALRSHAERAAANTPVQGTTSDLVLGSLVDAVHWILGGGARARLVLTVHDSLLFEVHPDDIDVLVRTVRGMMESWDVGHGVPLIADVKQGPAGGSLAKPKAHNPGCAP